MAKGSEKVISPTDKITTKTLLHEAIPLTGTIVSGTYGGNNIKNYAHGMFQSVFDYPYLSSSSNHVFDITIGYSAQSALSRSSNRQNAKKINIYNQMAQVLYGFQFDGNTDAPSIRRFDADGDLVGTTADKMNECYFITFSRLLVKDEIKKGSFNIVLGVGSGSVDASPVDRRPFNSKHSSHNASINIADTDAENSFKINSPVGEYGILYATKHAGQTPYEDVVESTGLKDNKVGLIFYQAGVMVLTSSVFLGKIAANGGILDKDAYDNVGTNDLGYHPIVHPMFKTGPNSHGQNHKDGTTVLNSFASGSISGSCDGLRARIMDVSFNNTIELNSSIYFCRVEHSEFNYSSNPTYLTSSQIRVKEQATDTPVAYITGVGLYDSNDNLMAVGKLSEPLRKDPTIEYTLRARLDY